MNRSLLYRSLVLFLTMALVLAGCAAAKPADTTTATEATTAPAPDQNTDATDSTDGVVEGQQITFFSVNLNETGIDNRYLMAYPNGDGTVYVEYVGEVKKIGTNMDGGVLDEIASAVVTSGLAALNGQEVYADGNAIGSAYVEFGSGSMISIAFSGQIPQEYMDAYAKLDATFRSLTAELEVYVPTPVVMEGVDEAALAELLAILEKSQIRDLDMFQITDVAKDDVFALVMGLSTAEGIARGTTCDAMMMTTPYSLVIATLEENGDAETVRNDFMNNLDWHRWVCVMPTDAMVAQKGNMVLCLMGADALYDQTAQAIRDCGWENMEQIHSPVA